MQTLEMKKKVFIQVQQLSGYKLQPTKPLLYIDTYLETIESV